MASRLSRTKPATPERRRTVFLAILALATAGLVPASIAWACNAQAIVQIPPTVESGSPVTISGASFKGDRQLTLSFDPGGVAGTVTTAANGAFTTTVTAPSAPGSYTLSAIGFEPDGTVTNGLPARASFTVVAASQPPPATSTPQPGGSGSGAPQPGATSPRTGSSLTTTGAPSTPRRGSGGRSESAAGGSGSVGTGSGDAGAGAISAGAGVVEDSAGTVFAGSIPRGERVAKSRAGAKAAAPSVRSVASDIWAGFESAKAPSLRAGAGEATLGGGPGSQLAWGVGLFALGLLALGSGLATGALKRRRAAAR